MKPEQLANQIALEIFKITKTKAIEKRICIKCKAQVTSFKDKLSEKEYFLSGFCQKCQDEYFGV